MHWGGQANRRSIGSSSEEDLKKVTQYGKGVIGVYILLYIFPTSVPDVLQNTPIRYQLLHSLPRPLKGNAPHFMILRDHHC